MEEDHDEEIDRKLEAINLMYETCTEDLSVSRLEEISERHGMLLQQQMFWVASNNTKRFLYDLREFSDWLYKYLELDLLDEDEFDQDF
jgi:hypothetical protein